MRFWRNNLLLRSATRWDSTQRVVIILILVAACTPMKGNPAVTSMSFSTENNLEAQVTSLTPTMEDNCPQNSAQSGLCNPDELQPASTSVTPTEPQTSQEATVSPFIPPLTPSPTTPPVTPTPTPCPPDLCTYSSQYFLARPIAPPGNDSVDVTYRFGSTQSGRRDPHHGVEFLNSSGTPVLAAADGVVVVAGDDRQPTSPHGVWPITFYGPYSYFYGNLVVIEHQLPKALLQSVPNLPPSSTLPQPIYTLYGHLSQISVQVGQPVTAGQEIGKVGMTGIAEGSHLHFEMRLGENSYKASRNPELWLKPHSDEQGRPMGGIAGRVLNSYGVNLQVSSIVIEHLPEGPEKPGDFQVTLLSYEEKALIGLTPFEESFGIGDLEAGWYRISYPYLGLQERLVQVFPGELTVVTLR